MKAPNKTIRLTGVIALVLWLTACSIQSDNEPQPASAANAFAPITIATARLSGDDPDDEKIRRLQEQVLAHPDRPHHLERLGWAFVEMARFKNDPGYYQLALQCAEAMSVDDERSPEAALLRGHSLHALHRFSEAEREATFLVENRGLAFDHGLLGDILLDRGDADGAAQAYQKMMDMKPDSHAFMRAGALRYVVGDVEGAARATRSGALATSPRRPETFAWAWSQVARYQLELRDLEGALRSTRHALTAYDESPSAWFQQGRMFLANRNPVAATASLRRAAARLDSPEILWAFAEALEASGQALEGAAVRKQLTGVRESRDPRGLALYLASQSANQNASQGLGQRPDEADDHRDQAARSLELARREIDQRQDPLTWDALAWALRANGQLEEAATSMRRALDSGIRNGRLSFHAGVIAAESGDTESARKWLSDANERRHTLLPSELAHLESYFETPRSTKNSS